MRRLFWLGVGVVAGASGTVWAERKVRTQLDALAPDHLVISAGNKAKSVGRSVAARCVRARTSCARASTRRAGPPARRCPDRIWPAALPPHDLGAPGTGVPPVTVEPALRLPGR
jgi:hypothetical protein